jgi:hypothetical protein
MIVLAAGPNALSRLMKADRAAECGTAQPSRVGANSSGSPSPAHEGDAGGSGVPGRGLPDPI